MSNPKKSFIEKPIVELEIAARDQAWRIYKKILVFLHLYTEAYSELKQLLMDLDAVVKCFFPMFRIEDDMPVQYFDKIYTGTSNISRSAPDVMVFVYGLIGWVGVSSNWQPIAGSLDAKLLGTISFNLINSGFTEAEIEKIHFKMIGDLKNEVPYLYDENGNKY